MHSCLFSENSNEEKYMRRWIIETFRWYKGSLNKPDFMRPIEVQQYGVVSISTSKQDGAGTKMVCKISRKPGTL